LYPSEPILIVDDEENFLLSAELTLAAGGITNVRKCSDSRNLFAKLKKEKVSVVLLDLNLPYISGMDLLPQIVENYPDIHVIVITAINEVENAVECMKAGAFDYIIKPVDDTRLLTTVRRALNLREIRNENVKLKEYLLEDKLEQPEIFENIITNDKNYRAIFRYIEAVANSPLPVLITGETGVGKELVANAIHKASVRTGEFVTVNVAGVDDTLFSDTLFGHKKGAYTGADNDRKGMIHLAESGTLFLDEIGDLSIESQVKLLRLLQEGKYYPLGSDTANLTDTRIVVATNRDLKKMIKEEKFRMDLFYRLRTHHIHIPPLRERRNDIPLLTDYFIAKAAVTLKKKKPTPPKELYSLLKTYNFPGNVRELEGIIFDAISMHKGGVLSLELFKRKLFEDNLNQINLTLNDVGESKRITFSHDFPTLKAAEKELIDEALKRADGNQTIAAQLLGISRRALNNRLRRLDEMNENDDNQG